MTFGSTGDLTGYQGEGVFDEKLGTFLEKHKDEREKFFIINKLPLFSDLYMKRFGWHLCDATDEQLDFGIREILKEQLEKNKTDYFDAYLFHALFDMKYSSDFDYDKEMALYKRMMKTLLELKKEGKIKRLGFSAHINYLTLFNFVEEMEAEFGKGVMDVAEVAYNILNDKGCDQYHPAIFAKMHNITVWDAVGEKGLKYLKDKGFTIIDMMPHESGRIYQITHAEDWTRWANKFVFDCPYIDYVLEGTSYTKHLDDMLIAAGEMKDPNPVPNMRIINAGAPSHCME